MISQVFLLSPRGDTLIFKDFKGNVPKSATDIFYRKARFWDGGQGSDAPPVFQVDGVHYIHISVGGLFWVATTRDNVSPSLILELLLRIYWITRDYCGIVTEETVRKNFLLVYELLDEIVDYGFPQNSSTGRLRQFVVMNPLVVRSSAAAGKAAPGAAAAAPSEIIKSVLDTERTGAREEVFVDIVEKLTAIFDGGGHLKTSSIVGAVQLKSYLAGNPPIRLGLNDNVILGGRGGHGPNNGGEGGWTANDPYQLLSSSSSLESVNLDTYSLHGDVDANKFNREKVLELVPPDGHFVLLSYRSSRSFRPPFRVYPLLEDDPHSFEKLTLYVRLRAEFPVNKTATGVEVTIPLPSGVERVHCECSEGGSGGGGGGGGLDGGFNDGVLGGGGNKSSGGGSGAGGAASSILNSLPVKIGGLQQSAEWMDKNKSITWSLKNLKGGREVLLKARLTVGSGCNGAARREYGPITLQFVLPGKPSASGLDVKYLKILKDEKGYNPSRWFRVVAMSNSYQIRSHV